MVGHIHSEILNNKNERTDDTCNMDVLQKYTE